MTKQFQQTAALEAVTDAPGAPQNAYASKDKPSAAVTEVLPEDPQIPASKPNIVKTVEEQVAEAIARLTITYGFPISRCELCS
jgi:hypothetical protein